MTNTSVNNYQPLSLNTNVLNGIINITTSADIYIGSITTNTGHISSTSGNIQTTKLSKNESAQTIACKGTSAKITAPTTVGVYLGMVSLGTGGIDIYCKLIQYIEITAPVLTIDGECCMHM